MSPSIFHNEAVWFSEILFMCLNLDPTFIIQMNCNIINVIDTPFLFKTLRGGMAPSGVIFHTLGNFINDMVFGDQRVSTKKWRWWAAFSTIFWNIYSQYRMAFNIGI